MFKVRRVDVLPEGKLKPSVWMFACVHQQTLFAFALLRRYTRGPMVLVPHTWRRQHGAQIVAQVEPDLHGLGTWRACAWSTNEPPLMAQNPRFFNAFVSAKAEADHLARTTFKHTCDIDTCGVWTPWPQPSSVF
jgi:hypothetical protein